MIEKFLKAIDEAQRAAMQTAVQPINKNVAYTAGVRIGMSMGLQQARQAILESFKDLNEKDDDL